MLEAGYAELSFQWSGFAGLGWITFKPMIRRIPVLMAPLGYAGLGWVIWIDTLSRASVVTTFISEPAAVGLFGVEPPQ